MQRFDESCRIRAAAERLAREQEPASAVAEPEAEPEPLVDRPSTDA
jgi:hypothetical protein